MDEEALQILNEYKNFNSNSNVNQLIDPNPNSLLADSLREIVFTEIKKKSKLYYETDLELFVYTPRNQILQIVIPYWPNVSIVITEYAVNKTINTEDEFILTIACFRKAYSKNTSTGIWSLKNIKKELSDTIFNQFKFSKIKKSEYFSTKNIILKYF